VLTERNRQSARPTDSAGWLALDDAHVAQSPYRPPLVLAGGKACTVWDVDGRRYLDFESGQFCMSAGHAHPHVAAAIGAQAEQLMQIACRFTTPPRIELAKRLADLSPEPLNMCLFASTGSEANEIALRLAKRTTGRFEVVALERRYHGRTPATLSLSSSTRGHAARLRPDGRRNCADPDAVPLPLPIRLPRRVQPRLLRSGHRDDRPRHLRCPGGGDRRVRAGSRRGHSRSHGLGASHA
jgi:4-aminobutyrate aminotransferase-like enzyme